MKNLIKYTIVALAMGYVSHGTIEAKTTRLINYTAEPVRFKISYTSGSSDIVLVEADQQQNFGLKGQVNNVSILDVNQNTKLAPQLAPITNPTEISFQPTGDWILFGEDL